MTTTPPAFTEHPNVTRVPTDAIPASAHPDAIRATQALIERFEAHHTPRGPIHDDEWYGWIPLRHDVFLAGLLACREILGPGRHSFLDVGSGIGTKLIIAHELGFRATGIERWDPYSYVSRELAPFATVIPSTAETFGSYRGFDVVYYYGLAADMNRDGRIKRHITDLMSPGALMFSARHPQPHWLEHVTGLIWRKP